MGNGLFPNAGQGTIHELVIQKHPRSNQPFDERTSLIDCPVLLRPQDHTERSDRRDSMSHGTTPSRTIVEHGPSWRANAIHDDLRFAEPKIPMLDARHTVTFSTRYCSAHSSAAEAV